MQKQMIEIIPAINCDSVEEVIKKIKQIEPYTTWAQIDVADGSFTKNTLWHNPDDLIDFETSINLEVHLMINKPEQRVMDWLLPQIKRVIFHIESTHDVDLVIDLCRSEGKEVGLAFGPDTPWTQVAQYKDKVDVFQVLGVYPGLPGQTMEEGTIEKIKNLHNFCADNSKGCIIEVDGGVNESNIKEVIAAGATKLVMASAIFGKADIKTAIEELIQLAN
jgi:ribulose-phosphate 3-epimerase